MLQRFCKLCDLYLDSIPRWFFCCLPLTLINIVSCTPWRTLAILKNISGNQVYVQTLEMSRPVKPVRGAMCWFDHEQFFHERVNISVLLTACKAKPHSQFFAACRFASTSYSVLMIMGVAHSFCTRALVSLVPSHHFTSGSTCQQPWLSKLHPKSSSSTRTSNSYLKNPLVLGPMEGLQGDTRPAPLCCQAPPSCPLPVQW